MKFAGNVTAGGVLALLCLTLTGCGSTATKVSPEEQARMQREEMQRAEAQKRARIEEAEQLGLLKLSDEGKVAFMREFLGRLRLAKNVNCDTVTSIGYYDAKTYVARCKNGQTFSAQKSGDNLMGTSGFFAATYFGVNFDDAVWFIGGAGN